VTVRFPDGDVGEAFGEVGEQAIARGWSEIEGERPLAQGLGVLAVQELLEVADQLGGEAALAPLVAEIEGTAVRGEDPDHAALEHLVEVARPRLVPDRQPSSGGRRGGRRLGCLRLGAQRVLGPGRPCQRREQHPDDCAHAA
jgi:hypothetical protein